MIALKQQVKIYKIVCARNISIHDQGAGYSLNPWGSNTTEIEGYDDGGMLYDLEDGYTLSATKYGDRAIYDVDQNHCDIVIHCSGRPQLVSATDKMPVLKQNRSDLTGRFLINRTEV